MRISHTLLALVLGFANIAFADALSTSEVSIALGNLSGTSAVCSDQSQLASAVSCSGGTAGPGVRSTSRAASSADPDAESLGINITLRI